MASKPFSAWELLNPSPATPEPQGFDFSRLARNAQFYVGGRLILSNEPQAIHPTRLREVVPVTLPILLKAWTLIEKATGYKWRCTSFIRHSPSHSKGHSLDLVPDFHPSVKSAYNGSNMSDPIMHSRPELFAALIPFSDVRIDPNYNVVAAIESDHIHLQVIKGYSYPQAFTVLRWKDFKPVYKDTVFRNNVVGSQLWQGI